VVSILCVVQFFWTLVHERQSLNAWILAATILGLILFLLLFQEMYRHGYRLARRKKT
jgi:hypothetical protein